jgi:hypothetical protein
MTERYENGTPLPNHQRQQTPATIAQINDLKDREKAILKLLEGLGQSRELSIAKTEIQTGFMWAIRHVAQPKD